MITVVQSLLVSLALGLAFDFSDINFIPVMFGIGYLAMKSLFIIQNESKTVSVGKFCLSTIFMLFTVAAQIERIIRFDSNILCFFSLIISMAGFYFLFHGLIGSLLAVLKDDSVVVDEKSCFKNRAMVLVGAFSVLLLVWGISFLVAYPGIFRVDTVEQLEQVVGMRNMDALFPFFSTLFLRVCWNLGLILWGDGNVGIGLYNCIQMIILALTVSYLIYRLNRCGVKRGICILVLMYYAFVPYHAHSSYTLLKDIPYSIGVLLFMQLMWEYYLYGEPSKNGIKVGKGIMFVVSGILMALSRANGFYAFLFALPFCVILFYKSRNKILKYLVMTLFAILIVRGPISDFVINQNNQKAHITEYPVFDVRYKDYELNNTEKEIVEKDKVTNINAGYGATGIYIITAQQLGRVTVDRVLSQEEYQKLSTVINVEQMKETYEKHLSTASMRQVHNRSAAEYLRVWLEFGLKYPYTYFIAWRDMTNGYWDPNLYTGEMNLDFCNYNPEVYADSFFPDEVVELRLRFNEVFVYGVPLVKLLYSNGFMVWLTFFGILLAAVKRNNLLTCLYTPLLGLWLTLLVASPLNGCFRYIYPFFLCLPLSLIIPFVRKQTGEESEEHILY